MTIKELKEYIKNRISHCEDVMVAKCDVDHIYSQWSWHKTAYQDILNMLDKIDD